MSHSINNFAMSTKLNCKQWFNKKNALSRKLSDYLHAMSTQKQQLIDLFRQVMTSIFSGE